MGLATPNPIKAFITNGNRMILSIPVLSRFLALMEFYSLGYAVILPRSSRGLITFAFSPLILLSGKH